MSSIRVLIADDHRLFRQGLAEVCRTKGGFDIVGEAENGRDAVKLAASTVANRLGTIYEKLRVNNRTQAALVALRRGWAALMVKAEPVMRAVSVASEAGRQRGKEAATAQYAALGEVYRTGKLTYFAPGR